MKNFTTSQFYLNYLISFFDIFGISEHCLFEEQLGSFKSATENTFNCYAVSAYDNPSILSGDNAHGGVALLWKCSINDWVTPLEDIISDRIVGIRLDFPKCDPLLFWVSICRQLQQNTRLMIILNICTICGQFMTSYPLRTLWSFWVILMVIQVIL